jgi:hypothetical protein
VRRQVGLALLGGVVGGSVALYGASANVKNVRPPSCVSPNVRNADGHCCPPGEEWFPSCSCCRPLAKQIAACESGRDPGACVAVGALYSNGAHFNLARAADMFEKACAQRLIAGCLKMALVYETGKGRPENRARAEAIYLRACGADVHCGCIVAGVVLTAPGRTERDARRGAAALTHACEIGDRSGCRWLARLYREGRGVAPDGKKADDLRARACAARDREACDGVDPVRLPEYPQTPLMHCRAERDSDALSGRLFPGRVRGRDPLRAAGHQE